MTRHGALVTDRHKVALVTGASSGIGAATAARLRRDGWQVETAERSTGVDLTDPEAAQAAVDRLDRIDALVANAGTIVRKPIAEHTLEEWDRIVGLNLRSVFVVCKAAAPRMVAQGSGAIVLVGSMTSFNGGFQQAAYAASKGGVAQLGKALSNELPGHGVRVNTIAPGFIETEMTTTVEPWRRKQIDERIPMGRWGEPAEIADVDRVPSLRRRALRHRRGHSRRRRLFGAVARGSYARPGVRGSPA